MEHGQSGNPVRTGPVGKTVRYGPERFWDGISTKAHYQHGDQHRLLMRHVQDGACPVR